MSVYCWATRCAGAWQRVLVVLLAGALSLTSRPALTQTPRPLPEWVRLLPDLQGMVMRDVAVGAVLAEDEPLDTPVPAARTDSARLELGLVRDRASLVAGFAGRWNKVFAVSDAGNAVNLVSARASLCRAGVSRRVAPQAYNGSAHEVLFLIAASFDRSLKGLPPPGLVSSGPGAEGSAVERLTAPIELVVTEGMTLQDALNALAARSRLGWFAKERCTASAAGCACHIGLITPTSVAWTTYDAAVGLLPEK